MTRPETRTLLLSSGKGPAECRQAVGHLLARILAEAEAQGLVADHATRDAAHGPDSATVVLHGAGAADLAARWQGGVQWRCTSTLRPGHRRKNWFVACFVAEQTPVTVEIRPDQIEMQAIRAGGPGGQHQNKTSSAIRARWRDPAGHVYAVVVRDHRSQHRNRKVAVERLQALASADAVQSQQDQKAEAHAQHARVARGGAVRVFVGPDFTAVRS